MADYEIDGLHVFFPENEDFITFEDVEVLRSVVLLGAEDHILACLKSDLNIGPKVDGPLLADITYEFSEAVEHLSIWGDLDSHDDAEPMEDWERKILGL